MKKYFYFIGIAVILFFAALLISRQPSRGLIVDEINNIRIYEPQPGDTVGQPLIIVGKVREPENNFNYRLLDSEGHQLAGSFATAVAIDVGKFGAFSVVLNYGEPAGSSGTVEVFSHSAKDGAVIDLVRIPVKLKKEARTVIKAYFDLPATKISSNPSLIIEQCEGVYPVMRVVPKTTAVARAALEELFQGPNLAEQRAGYTTLINKGVKVKSLNIESGLATVDLSSDLMYQVGGSCRVGMMIDQIESTLRQFSSVQSVKILVDGNADALQP